MLNTERDRWKGLHVEEQNQEGTNNDMFLRDQTFGITRKYDNYYYVDSRIRSSEQKSNSRGGISNVKRRTVIYGSHTFSRTWSRRNLPCVEGRKFHGPPTRDDKGQRPGDAHSYGFYG